MMTRRKFMGALTAIATAGGLGLGGVFALRKRLTLAQIKPATALPLQNAVAFLRAPGSRPLRAIIADVSVVRHRAGPGAPGTENISLLFKTDNREAPAGFYRVETDDVSLDHLYLSPVGMPGRERRLEAVITRIV